MLRILGLLTVVVICVGMGLWGVLVGALLCLGSLVFGRMSLFETSRPTSSHQRPKLAETLNNLDAIPLVNAVYCANCDLITNSPHDRCRVCCSPSIIGISRMWQLTLGEAPTKEGKFKVSFTADVRDI